MAKGKKKEGKARKAEARGREKGRRRGGALDQRQLASFADELRLHGFALHPVARDGNCFFRSLADQLDSQQQRYDDYRQRVVAYMEAHEDDYAPFLTFGEGDEEDDRDFHEYTARMRRDGEWAGQPELLAAARALDVDIVVHQHEMPSYRLSCGKAHARCIHLSYHNGEHYNSVHPLSPAPRAASEKVDVAEELASPSELSVLQGSGCSDLKASAPPPLLAFALPSPPLLAFALPSPPLLALPSPPLLALGFPRRPTWRRPARQAARAALRRSDHDVESAIEWLASGLADATLAQGEADQPEEESGAGPSAATEEEEEKEGEVRRVLCTCPHNLTSVTERFNP
ncbi:hypothetical protein AB1Y20_005906 [Prymnesium parvum]|uniref:Deubiquitinating enzyme A n=1 Tax=Prymnesium parvum TaxID=97485 RepID=A0AB34J0S2_PRYPA